MLKLFWQVLLPKKHIDGGLDSTGLEGSLFWVRLVLWKVNNFQIYTQTFLDWANLLKRPTYSSYVVAQLMEEYIERSSTRHLESGNILKLDIFVSGF
jgi:hypothetical protein